MTTLTLDVVERFYDELWAVCQDTAKNPPESRTEAINTVFRYMLSLMDGGDSDVGIPVMYTVIPENCEYHGLPPLDPYPKGKRLNAQQTLEMLFEERRLGSNPVVDICLKVATHKGAQTEGALIDHLHDAVFSVLTNMDGVSSFYAEVILEWDIEGSVTSGSGLLMLHDYWFPSLHNEMREEG